MRNKIYKKTFLSILISLLIITSFLWILQISFISASTKMTGKASSQPTNVAIYVAPAVPVLRILSPNSSASYSEGENILLDFIAILIDTIWYNLDNGQNITINSSLYFKTSPGTHTLYLYGNDSNGTVLSDNVTFNVKKEEAGGKPKVKIPQVKFEKEIIEIKLQQGEQKTVSIFIENNKKNKVDVSIINLNSEDLLVNISEANFSLNPGQKKEIFITFNVPLNKTPGIYIEKLLIKAGNLKKEIVFCIEVKLKKSLFDLSLKMPEPAVYHPGDEIPTKITIYNLGKQGKTQINLRYFIKNLENKTILSENQTLLVGVSTTVLKTFKLPKTMKKGYYIFYVKALYDNKTSVTSKTFQIIEPAKIPLLPKPEKIINKLKENQKYIAQAAAVFIAMIILSSIIKSILGGAAWKALFLKRKTTAAVKKYRIQKPLKIKKITKFKKSAKFTKSSKFKKK